MCILVRVLVAELRNGKIESFWEGRDYALSSWVGHTEAGTTGNSGLDGDAVADGKVGDLRAGPDDFAGAFVAEDVRASNDERGEDAYFPEMKIRAEASRSVSGNEEEVANVPGKYVHGLCDICIQFLAANGKSSSRFRDYHLHVG